MYGVLTVTVLLYILIFLVCIILVLGAAAYDKTLERHVEEKTHLRGMMFPSGKEPGEMVGDAWLKSKGHPRRIWLTSADHIRLHAYVIPNPKPTHRWVILAHAMESDADRMSCYGEQFEKMGFNVMMVNERSHGHSKGSGATYGCQDHKDMIGWTHRLLDLVDAEAEILLFGVSGGATAMLLASGEELPEQVKAIVADSALYSGWTVMDRFLRKEYKATRFLMSNPLNIMGIIRCGINMKAYRGMTVQELQKTKLPILFIHGEKDTFSPIGEEKKLFAAAAGPKEELIIPGASHMETAFVDPALYWETIETFTNQYIPQGDNIPDAPVGQRVPDTYEWVNPAGEAAQQNPEEAAGTEESETDGTEPSDSDGTEDGADAREDSVKSAKSEP